MTLKNLETYNYKAIAMNKFLLQFQDTTEYEVWVIIIAPVFCIYHRRRIKKID